jgi:hypothetical protein
MTHDRRGEAERQEDQGYIYPDNYVYKTISLYGGLTYMSLFTVNNACIPISVINNAVIPIAARSLSFTGPTSTEIGRPIVSGSAGSVLFVDSFGNLSQDASSLIWNDSTKTFAMTGTPVFSPGGTEKMRVTSSGVGIGTSDPSAQLHLNLSAASSIAHIIQSSPFITANITSVEVVSGVVIAHVDSIAGFAIGQYATVAGLTANSWLNGRQRVNQPLSGPPRLILAAVHADQSSTPDSGTIVVNSHTANLKEYRDGNGVIVTSVGRHGGLTVTTPSYSYDPCITIKGTTNPESTASIAVAWRSPNVVVNDEYDAYFTTFGDLYTRTVICASGHFIGNVASGTYRIKTPDENIGSNSPFGCNLNVWSDVRVAAVFRDNSSGYLAPDASWNLICINDYNATYGFAITGSCKLGWGDTTTLTNGVPALDTWLYRASSGVLETAGHFSVRGTSARLDIINDTDTWSINSITGSTDLEWQLGGLSVFSLSGLSTRRGQVNLFAPSAQAAGCGFNLFSGVGKIGSITQNSSGHILILPDSTSGVVYLGFSFTTYASNNGDFNVGGNMIASGIVNAKGIATAIVNKTTTYTITTSDSIITADATSAAFAVTLPAANAVTAGRQFTVKKTDVSGNAVTVTRAGSDTIDGATTYALSAQYKFVILVSDGISKWLIVGSN